MTLMLGKALWRRGRISNFRPYAVLTVLSILVLIQTFSIPSVESQKSTHSVFIEIFSSTWCEPCSREQSVIQRLSGNESHMVHFVVFHLQDIWSTTYSVERATELDFTFVPSHAYDGGYARISGAIVEQSGIESVASRNVHLVELTVSSSTNGSVLNAQVAVAERNGYSFSGEVAAYVVENGINIDGVQWNSVYKGQLFRQGVFLKPNSYIVLSGNWSISHDSKPDNLQVVAVAFDKSTVGRYGPYAVQSACDKDSSVVIPEFGGWLPLLVTSTIFITAFMFRRLRVKGNLTS